MPTQSYDTPAGARREKALMIVLMVAMVGVIGLLSALGWYAWRQSIGAEEARLGALAERLGQRAETVLTDARTLLEMLNNSTVARCSDKHIRTMQEEAIARPYVRAVGSWRAAERQCGVGFIQGNALKPPKASKIYPNGVVAWWPGPDTALGNVELFIMRLGEHDLAIDTRLVLDQRLSGEQRAGLWVDGLLLANSPPDAVLPEPTTLSRGLNIAPESNTIVARFSLDTIFPMDVVAVQSSGHFFSRYAKTLAAAGVLGLLLMGLWFLFVKHLSKRHLSLTAELRSAIDHDGIDAVYQPIVDLNTGRCVGAEILARWERSDGEMIRPDLFVAIAEQQGIIGGITHNVFRRAIGDLGKLLRKQSDLRINLNLSPLDLEDNAIADLLETELRKARLPAATFKLEITERGLIDSEEARALISALRQRGHQIAIDDFGTGYSSLSYLESFELDTLKLDKAFVDAIETRAVTSSVIPHVIEMARSLELDMVAEGIESEHQAQWLREQGVQMGQGYLYSKPLSAADFKAYLKTSG
ncbi:EAL domain protein [Luminiphilus syltensis NOR5-1B]|uniref:cyclic-guanylate-specific phosphodiesterase n=2 Tax=Luminiphilus TaxID=1341118 RepID=B8KTI7_9GAMM|nr:EAL domain protein [Luminiphilus syltensis NOR5-1B]